MCAASGALQALAGPLLVCRSHCAPWLGTVIRALLRALTARTTTATSTGSNTLQSTDGASLRGLLQQLLLPNSANTCTTASGEHTASSAAAVAELMSTAGLTTTNNAANSTTGGSGGTSEFDLEAVSGLLALQLAAPSEQLGALVAAVTAACPDAAALAGRAFLQQELAAAAAAVAHSTAAAVGSSASTTAAALVRGDPLHAAAFADHLCSVLAALPGTRNSIHNSLFTSVILPNYAVSMQQ
jgi:hypothetical protein